ncbi:ankyrin repeat domain-containing protein [Pseudoxanthomonas sp. OG2]|uniref:ankyrin repeat domain-containing protein n=1 Tax=Pseudoxanthomonas sp. OG2 TaxID=2587011 RepID=UPI001616C3B8|nr:ankyrin repeat domain-containing protein [Pseudoxanthomonas sp. OG2]MBB3277377.1 ankyrin repeat protein [Pseudoxanthomonas sp. OG2]
MSASSDDLQSRFAEAALAGNLAECQRLHALGADVNHADKDRFTPLHEAAQGGHPEVCEWLISQGAQVDAVDKTNNTPLHEAARFNQPQAVMSLINAGASLERPGYEGATPLYEAAIYGSKDALEALIARGADIQARIGHTQWDTVTRKLLYDAKVLRETTFSNFTALHAAAQAGAYCSSPNRPDHQGCAAALLAAGADINVKARVKATLKNVLPTGDVVDHSFSLLPLNAATTLDMAKLLIAHGAPLEGNPSPFATAVGVVKGQQGMDIAAFLLNQGYQPTEYDQKLMAKVGMEQGVLDHRAHEMRATERQQHLEERLNQAPSAALHASSPSTPSMVIGGEVWNAREDVQVQPTAVQQSLRQRLRL